MIPTPTPIVLSGPTGSGEIPLVVWLIFVAAVGLQVLLFYRRRKLVLKIREEKKRNRAS